MNRLVYKYDFSEHIPVGDIESLLMIAAVAAEALHGRAAMKMDAYFRLDRKTRTCVVDADTRLGCDIARILTTFITMGFGESSFRVDVSEEHSGVQKLLRAVGVAM